MVERRSARVRLVRIVCVSIAALSAFALVGSVAIRLMLPSNIDTESLVQGDSFVIERPKFTAVSEGGAKITVTAARALRAIGDVQGELRLENPRMETSEGSIATSQNGIWNEAGQTLQMSGDVLFQGQRGEKARAQEANWTSANRRMALRGSMQVEMDSGVANADQGVWDDLGQTLGLQGNVRMVLKQGEVAAANSAFWNGVNKSLALDGNARITGSQGEVAVAPKAVWYATQRLLVLQDGASLETSQGQARAQTITWNANSNDLRLVQNAAFVTKTGESASGGQIDWNALSRTMVLTNKAYITFKGGSMRSDAARYSMISGSLSGAGNVQVTSDAGIGTGSNFVYETRTRRLKLTGTARITIR
jgi:hypothetical protein